MLRSATNIRYIIQEVAITKFFKVYVSLLSDSILVALVAAQTPWKMYLN